MKTLRRFLLVTLLGMASGPAIVLGAAEIAFFRHGTLAVPIWNRSLLFLFVWGGQAFVVAAVVTGLLFWWYRALPKPVSYALGVIWLLNVSTISLGLSLASVSNMLYDRYSPILLHATTWVPGYSEPRFSQISIGMTAAQVLRAAGEPIDRVPTDGRGLEVLPHWPLPKPGREGVPSKGSRV